MEHNMVASSRIYDNVSFKELGMLLQIPCQQVRVSLCVFVFLGFALQYFYWPMSISPWAIRAER